MKGQDHIGITTGTERPYLVAFLVTTRVIVVVIAVVAKLGLRTARETRMVFKAQAVPLLNMVIVVVKVISMALSL